MKPAPRRARLTGMGHNAVEQQETPALDADLVARLDSKKAQEREAAEQRLEQLGPRQVDELLAIVREEAEKRRRRGIIRRRIAIGYVSFLGVMVCAWLADGILTHHWVNLGGFGGMFSSMGALFAASAMSTAQKSATKRLAQFDDVRAVGPLVDALTGPDRALRNTIEPKLTDLLPRVRASDAYLLTAEQLDALCRCMKEDRPLLVLAILEALKQVGGEKAIPHVEKLLDKTYPSGRRDIVARAAEDCLPALRQRAEQQRAARTLVRATSAPDDPSAVLLRPAGIAGPTPAEQLLRPVDDAPHEERE